MTDQQSNIIRTSLLKEPVPRSHIPDTERLQATFPVEEIQCDCIPYHIYEMSWDQFIGCHQSVQVRQYDIKEGLIKSISVNLTRDYVAAYKAISKDCRISKQNTLANALKLGNSIWQHDHHEVYKRTVDARQKLYHTNYSAYMEIFGKQHKIWEYQEGARSRTNIYGDTRSLIPAISEYSDYLNISESEFCAVLLGLAFLKWDGLPQQAREIFTTDITQCIEQQTRIVKACGGLIDST